MKDKKRKYILMIILLGVLMLLSGCVRKECEAVSYTHLTLPTIRLV